MLKWAVIFLVIALVAALLGFTGNRDGCGWYREVPVLPVPGVVRHLLHRWRLGCEKNHGQLRPSARRGSRANLNPASSGAGGKFFASARN